MDDYHTKLFSGQLSADALSHRRFSVRGRDLIWIARSVHNEHHASNEGPDIAWDKCQKGPCELVQKIILSGA